MPEPFILNCDHAQRRLAVSSVHMALKGPELINESLSSGVMLDPIRGSLMLRPSCLESAWWTSNAGLYAKPTIASGYEVKTSGKWVEPELYPGAGKFLQCDNASGEYARTSTAPGINRGVTLSYFGYANGDRGVLLECGWSDSTSPTAESASMGLRIYTDGLVQLFRGGDQVGQYSISGAGAGAKGSAGRSTQNELVTLVLLPCRRREFVVFSTAGYGFAHVCDDLEEADSDLIITPAEKFFVVPGSGVTNLQLQFAPLRFEASGYSVSERYQFGIAPAPTQDVWLFNNPVFTAVENASLYGDVTYGGTSNVDTCELLNASGSGAFVADEDATGARIKLTFSSDGAYTPFLYGAAVEFSGEVVETDDSEMTALAPYAQQVTLTVPDDPLGTTLSIRLRGKLEEVVYDEDEEADVEQETILETAVPGIASQSFRPVELQIEGLQIFDGYTTKPSFTDGIHEGVHSIALECLGIERMLEMLVFRSRVAFDGWPLCLPIEVGESAVSYVLRAGGIADERMVLSDLGYTLGEVPNGESDEWNIAAEEGETLAQVLGKLHRLAADCLYGTHPGVNGPEFWFLSPEDLPDTPVVTLYRSLEDVEAALPELSDDERIDLLYHSFEEEVLAIEANEVRATGVEPRSGAIIQSFAVDEDSQDPTLPPSARPNNWVGNPLPLGVAARQFRRQEDTDKAVEKLLPIATEQGTVCGYGANTFLLYSAPIDEETSVLLPVWRMDLVHLDQIGDRRTSSLTANFLREHEDCVHRTARYTGGVVRGRGGTTVADIQSASEARAVNRIIEDLQRAPLEATGVIAVRRYTP